MTVFRYWTFPLTIYLLPDLLPALVPGQCPLPSVEDRHRQGPKTRDFLIGVRKSEQSLTGRRELAFVLIVEEGRGLSLGLKLELSPLGVEAQVSTVSGS